VTERERERERERENARARESERKRERARKRERERERERERGRCLSLVETALLKNKLPQKQDLLHLFKHFISVEFVCGCCGACSCNIEV
jgi:hypothetical protein